MDTLSLVRMTVLLSCCSAGTLHGEDWYRFRGPRLDGVSKETDWTHQWPSGGPKLLWQADVGTGFSAVSIRDQRAFTIGNADNVDTVYCLNVDDGEVLWQHRYDSATDPNEFEGGPTSTPTLDDQTVYTLGRRGDVHAIDQSSGKVLWSKNAAQTANVRIPAWGFSGSPLVLGNRLILNVGDAGVALDKKSGDVLWVSDDKDAGYSSIIPVEINGRQSIVFGSARSYVAVDPATGEERWRQRWLTTFGCNAADPILSGSSIFLSSGYNRGSALLDLRDEPPSIIWKHKDFQNQLSTSVLIDGFLYGASGDVDAGAVLICMDLATGEVQWREESIRMGGLSAAVDRLILLSESGELIIAQASPDAFTAMASHRIGQGKCWTAPVLSGGRLYVRFADGRVMCFDVRN